MAADTCDLRYARDCLQLIAKVPILNRAKLSQVMLSSPVD